MTGVDRTLLPRDALRLPLFSERQELQRCRECDPRLLLVILLRLTITLCCRLLNRYSRSLCTLPTTVSFYCCTRVSMAIVLLYKKGIS